MLKVGQVYTFHATLPNREVAEWFTYKTRSAVSFDIPPSFGDNLFGVAFWVVYKCRTADVSSVLTAVISNETRCSKRYHAIRAPDIIVDEIQAVVESMSGEDISSKVEIAFTFLFWVMA